MAINLNNADHRARMARSADHSLSELMRYHRMRSDTVTAYLGINPFEPEYEWGASKSSKYRRALPQGNLLQMSALGTQIALAYGEPQYSALAREPDNIGQAESLEAALNRMSMLLDFGETARKVAADSFFGYGIFKVGVGRLPLSAQAALGLRVGPCIWRVGQPDFLYDISANDFNNCAFMGDLYTTPLSDAQEIFKGQEDRLAEMSDMDRMDTYRTMGRPSRFWTPEPMVQLFDGFLPGSRVVGTWCIQQGNMRSIADAPLSIREYNGHWSGLYSVLTHLYSPDELVPIAQAESVKALHYLFNDILSLTSDQARNAKVNTLYQNNSEKDMKKIWDAADRVPVPVTDPTRFTNFEIPGPSQPQTMYMSAIMNMFKQMSFNLDAQLGLAPTSGTATQSTLINERTNAMIAETRRKFHRCLQLVGYKLGHLMMRDQNLFIPLRRPLMPGSKISIDVSWMPASKRPQTTIVDDYDIPVDSYSLRQREPMERLQQITQVAQQIILPAMAAQAQGMPISAENVLATAAKYSGNPELRDWFEPADPMYTEKKNSSRFDAKRPDVGHYVRENVSGGDGAGELNEALQNMGNAPTGQAPQR